MRTRLLVGGTVLVLLALGSDHQWLSGNAVRAEVASQNHTVRKALADPVGQSVSDAFDSVLSDAVQSGLKNAERTLALYETPLRNTYGETGRQARTLAKDVADACARARTELEAGRTSIAMDYVIQASQDLDELKMVFERR